MSVKNEGPERGTVLRQCIKTAALITAGAGLGILGGVAAITVAVVAWETVLPVKVCLWAAGVTGGAVGLSLGVKTKNNRSTPQIVRQGVNTGSKEVKEDDA
jgi:hypothetical protein